MIPNRLRSAARLSRPHVRRSGFRPSVAEVSAPAAERLEDRTLLAAFDFAGFTFEQDDTPDQSVLLGVGAVPDGDGAVITAVPTDDTSVVNFPNPPVDGFEDDLTLGVLAFGNSTTPAPDGDEGRALNLPEGNDGTSARSGIELSWTGGRFLTNGAGDDFVVFESASNNASPEAFMVQVRDTDGNWSDWRYEQEDAFANYDPAQGAQGAFAVAFDLDDFGVNTADAIRIVNMTDEDRMEDASGVGDVIPEDDGATSNTLPDPGPFAGFPAFGGGTFDPDPLYVGALSPVVAPSTVIFIGSPADQAAEEPGSILITPTAGQNLTIDLSDSQYDGIDEIILDDSAAALSALQILGDDDNDVTVTVNSGSDAGDLHFVGSDADESVVIEDGAIVDSFSFSGGNGEDNLTLEDGAEIAGALLFRGGDGADEVNVTDATVGGKAVFDLGLGDDVVTVNILTASRIVALGRAGSDDFTLIDLSADSVAVGGDGFGLDQVGIGEGSDVIFMAQTNPGRMIAGTLAIDAGNGNDSLFVASVDAGRIVALGRGGIDNFVLNAVAADAGVVMLGGDGDDNLNVVGNLAGQILGKLIVDGGVGDDEIDVDDVVADRVVLLGRDGDDEFNVNNVLADAGVVLQGDAGSDALNFTGDPAEQILGKLILDGGVGDDEIDVADVFADRIVLLGRDGDDEFDVTNVLADAGVVLQADAGSDALNFTGDPTEQILGKLIVDLGAGDQDSAQLTDVFADRLIVLGRAGADDVVLNAVEVTGSLIALGGDGSDSLGFVNTTAGDYCIGVGNVCDVTGMGAVPAGPFND